MACSASSGVAISTKPKPRDRPVSRSVTTLADSTLPVAAKASRRRSLEVENERPPTKSLTAMEGLLLPSEPVRDPELGRRSGTRPDGEEGSRRTDDRTRQSKYTLANNLRSMNVARGAIGRGLHRASQVRRPVPRAPRRRAGRANPRRSADRRRWCPVTHGRDAVVGRAAGVHRGSALRRRHPLLGRPSLGRAGPQLAPRAARPEPRARGAADRGVPEPRREDRVHGPPRDGAPTGGLPHGRDRARALLEVPRDRRRRRPAGGAVQP